MNEIKLSKEMMDKAVALNTGDVIYAYNDHGTIRMETQDGEDPYVWRGGSWKAMTLESTVAGQRNIQRNRHGK